MSMLHQIIDAGMGPFPKVQVGNPLEIYNATSFTPKAYTVPKIVESQHHFTRFGNTNNFQAFVSGVVSHSTDDGKNYIVGVCAAAMLILSIALVWGMVIIGLKSVGQKKVGFLAGRLVHPDFEAEDSLRDSGTLPVIEEEPAEEETESLVESEDVGGIPQLELETDPGSPLLISNTIDIDLEYAKKETDFNRKVIAVRGAFVCSALAVMVCGILFYSKGVTSFERSLDTVSSSLDLAQSTADHVIVFTENLKVDKNQLLNGFRDTKNQVGSEFLCNGAGPIAKNIQSRVKEIDAEITAVNSEVDRRVDMFVADLQQAQILLDDIDNQLQAANIIFYVTIAISAIVNVLILTMLIMTFFSAKGIETCCTKFLTYGLLWPLFIFFLVLFWMFTLLFLVASLVGADFCVKPDVLVEDLFRQYQDLFHSVIFQYGLYYISGCRILPVTDEIDSITTTLDDVVNTVHDLSELVMSQPLDVLEGQCGLNVAAANALIAGAGLMQNASHVINNAWIDVRQFLECKTFNPIYTAVVHDAICIDGVDGLAWLFSTSLSLAVFAMTMITFRAALYPVKRPPSRAESSGLEASPFRKSGH